MPYYETVFIARQDVSAQAVEQLAKEFGKIIADGGGSVARTEHWGLKTLAYKIKKNRKGHYVLMHLDSPHAAVHEMQRQMRLHDDILREVTLRLEALPTEESVQMKKDKDKDKDRDRESRGGKPGRNQRKGEAA